VGGGTQFQPVVDAADVGTGAFVDSDDAAAGGGVEGGEAGLGTLVAAQPGAGSR
jgi:hypothetical protein